MSAEENSNAGDENESHSSTESDAASSDASSGQSETLSVQSEARSGQSEAQDEGPGCLPAILAASVLMGIFSLVICAFGTWFIYQNRDQIALRSIRGAFIPALEQSRLGPDEKARTIKLLSEFGDELERGKFEAWQASGVMQRLTRLPIFEWGKIQAVESFVRANASEFAEDDVLQFQRLRKGAELGELTAIDFQHILSPVVEGSDSPTRTSMVEPLLIEPVREVVNRARVSADRSNVSKDPRGDVSIDTLVRRQIEAGIEKGSY